jgi:hypothetical protein
VCQISRQLVWRSVGLGWIEVKAPLHSLPTNSEPKSDEIFGGLFGYHMFLECCNYSIFLDPVGEKKNLCPLPCAPTNRIAISRSVRFVDVHLLTSFQ